MEYKIRYYIVGKGSNILFTDEDKDCLVLKFSDNLDQISLRQDNDIMAMAGASLEYVNNFALNNGLTGMEFSYGIPGTVGGAIVMNAGAYDGEMKDIVKDVLVLDKYLNIVSISNDDMGFGYRSSRIIKDTLVVLAVVFTLSKGDKSSIEDKMNKLYARRISKQPMEHPSAGSIFKRPKGLFAGKLIADSGLIGYTIGGAQVSHKHAGFIVNIGDAKASEVINLISFIQDTVKVKFGVYLEPEIKIL
jgi:UDP-N-acetylmuramate dehydrogenase